MIPQWTQCRRLNPISFPQRIRDAAHTLDHSVQPTEQMALTFKKMNAAPPAGIGVPDLDTCEVDYHDYGNNNIHAVYTCEQIDSFGRHYRCTWSQWDNEPLHFDGCVELAPRPHYFDPHGPPPGPQGLAPRQLPPYIPSTGMGRLMNPARTKWEALRASAQAAHAPAEPDDIATPVCPKGEEPCGDPLPGQMPPCCKKTKYGARYAQVISAHNAVAAFFRPLARGVSRIANLGRKRYSPNGGCGSCTG